MSVVEQPLREDRTPQAFAECGCPESRYLRRALAAISAIAASSSCGGGTAWLKIAEILDAVDEQQPIPPP